MLYSVIAAHDGDIYHDEVEANDVDEAYSKARAQLARAWHLTERLEDFIAEGDEEGFDGELDGFAVDPLIHQEADVELVAAASGLINEFGGNVPDWLRPAVSRLESALTAVKEARDDQL